MKIKLKIASRLSGIFTLNRQSISLWQAFLCVNLFLLLSGGTALAQLRAESNKILVVGDSLSAAYGIAVEDGWVALLQHKIDGTRHTVDVINASVSGDTSANGLTRLPALLKEYSPAVVILELGGNDGLRGLSVKKLQQNLIQMTEAAQAQDAQVIILGMKIPSNYGAAYTRSFSRTFVESAKSTDALLVPFFLEGLATSREWFQGDGIHPNEKAQEIMLNNVWEVLSPVLDSLPVN